MNDPLQINELGWRQQLTKAEEAQLQAHLAKHPEAQAELELEKALTRSLNRLPAAPPVASNFTTRVMQTVGRERSRQERSTTPVPILFRLRRWLPGAAVTCVLVAAGLLAVHEQRVHARALMAQRITRLADAAAALGPEPINHFGPIARLADTPPAADTELTALVVSMR